MTPRDLMGFWSWAQVEPERPALVTASNQRITFGELFQDVNRLSHGLANVANVHKGDVVASVMTNSPEFIKLYLATMQSGVYLTTLNYHLTEPEIRYILQDCEAKVVICASQFETLVSKAVEGLDVVVYSEGAATGCNDFADLFTDQSAELPAERPAGSVMQYTSGTTGRPKGVKRPLSGKTADEGAQVYRWIFDDYGMKPGVDGVWLVTAPMYHAANISNAMGVLHLGYCVVLMDGWTPEKCLQLISTEHVTSTHMVPTHFIRLLQLKKEVRDRYDVSSLQFVTHGAAPCPIEIKKQMFEWFGPVIFEYYGSTEVGSTLAKPHEWLSHPGTVGRPMSIAELKILDDEGNEVPAGTVGTVYMRQGEDVMEYHNDPGKTESIRRGRLLTVGDLGYVDEEGYLYLAGRSVELIISGGVNVYPAEIEAVLILHEAIYDVAVISKDHPDLGEVPIAAIELLPGFVPSDELKGIIMGFCKERLSRQKLPKELHFVESLPRDENGKIYKKKILVR